MSDQIAKLFKELLPKQPAYRNEFKYTPKYVAINKDRTVWVSLELPEWYEGGGYYITHDSFNHSDEVIVSEYVYQLLQKHKVMEIVV